MKIYKNKEMRNRNMKKWLCPLLLLALSFALFSCISDNGEDSSSSESVSESVSESLEESVKEQEKETVYEGDDNETDIEDLLGGIVP